MSQKERTDPIGRLDLSDSPDGNLARLADLARQAYDRKDTKECLDLTRAMLLIDPDHEDAQWMRSSIQADMHRDLESARALLRPPQFKENSETQLPPGPSAVPSALQQEPVPEGIDVSVQPASLSTAKRWLIAVSTFIVLAVAVGSITSFRARSSPVKAAVPLLSAPDASTALASRTVQDALLLARFVQREPERYTPPVVVAAPSAIAARVLTVPPPIAERTGRPSNDLLVPPVTTAFMGILAISSPTSVDIYKDDVYVGSVPITLDLPAGTHTFEYRHDTLRKTLTHVIHSNETTKEMITFDVAVQINSKPWSNVFVDGGERKALGQTPLSGVRVPIGTVLSFENPQFQTRKYRVTGKETGIQIVFP